MRNINNNGSTNAFVEVSNDFNNVNPVVAESNDEELIYSNQNR